MRRTLLLCTAVALAIACGEGPTSVPEGSEPSGGELVVTRGVAAPAQPSQNRPSFSDAAAAANLGGSSTTPLSLKPQSCEPGREVVVTYTITGRQVNPASFKVNTRWEYNGSSWTGSLPTTVSVAARAAGDDATVKQVTITAINVSDPAVTTGTSSFSIVPFDLLTTPQATLSVTSANVIVHVDFDACIVANTPPTLTLPNDFTVEATSSAGAIVPFTVMATDTEDGDLTLSVVCAPASGSTFALGETTVNCSVTDNGGLSASGSFKIKVQDTTAPTFTAFPGNQSLIAADINGALLDLSSLVITAADVNNVSPPVTVSCKIGSDDADGYLISIGATAIVSCTATDNSQYPSPNTSAASTFSVFVGLNVSASGFLPPLRMIDPFSLHKRGSTIPHKFLPPTYADGTPATDLAAGLTLVLKRIDGTVDYDDIPVNDYSAGSTTWRFADGQYIFNLKTGTSSPWDPGTWKTTVSYAGIMLAMTQFDLRK